MLNNMILGSVCPPGGVFSNNARPDGTDRNGQCLCNPVGNANVACTVCDASVMM